MTVPPMIWLRAGFSSRMDGVSKTLPRVTVVTPAAGEATQRLSR
jgi:hypothetical protein